MVAQIGKKKTCSVMDSPFNVQLNILLNLIWFNLDIPEDISILKYKNNCFNLILKQVNLISRNSSIKEN